MSGSGPVLVRTWQKCPKWPKMIKTRIPGFWIPDFDHFKTLDFMWLRRWREVKTQDPVKLLSQGIPGSLEAKYSAPKAGTGPRPLA